MQRVEGMLAASIARRNLEKLEADHPELQNVINVVAKIEAAYIKDPR